MRDLIAKGLPGGFDACDAALYADEPKLMHKYTRGDGGVVYEYYARENAQSETVCGARCFVRERFTHVNITDVALEGTTESTRREAPGVAEREGPCAALCPGVVGGNRYTRAQLGGGSNLGRARRSCPATPPRSRRRAGPTRPRRSPPRRSR